MSDCLLYVSLSDVAWGWKNLHTAYCRPVIPVTRGTDLWLLSVWPFQLFSERTPPYTPYTTFWDVCGGNIALSTKLNRASIGNSLSSFLKPRKLLKLRKICGLLAGYIVRRWDSMNIKCTVHRCVEPFCAAYWRQRTTRVDVDTSSSDHYWSICGNLPSSPYLYLLLLK